MGAFLYLLSGILALAWHREVHHQIPGGRLLSWLDGWVSRQGRTQAWIASIALLVVLASMIFLLGSQAHFQDPWTWYDSARALLAGGNPYAPVGEMGIVVAYATPFVLVEALFVAGFGFHGTFLASAVLAALLPPLLYAAGKAYRNARVGAYAGFLGVTLPFLAFYSARWAGEDIWVALAVIAALYLLLTDRPMAGFAVAGVLAVKFVAFIPLAGWALVAWRRQGIVQAVRWGLAAALPYLAILVISVLLWGTGYVETLYLEHTVERSATQRPTANLFHLAQLAGWIPPSWMFIPVAGALLGALLYVGWVPIEDPVRSATLLFSLSLLSINTMSADFVIWVLPLALLYT
ncbi:MAG: hypothetical protein R3185_06945, partial [Candidatus Thermoplasmatota archaeon]|nr:hypothetical protein [Candidatus Thermoplasmatota archaeon]